MSFQPVIPMSGLGGWKFLQATFDRQLEKYSASPQVRRERDEMTAKLSEPISLENFVKDKRLLKSALTAFGLAGEEWKGGFITKVLKEAADPESNFLQRLNNPRYTAFAEAFRPVGGVIEVDTDALAKIAVRFEQNAFNIAVGEIDDTMRLALNYQSEINDLVGEGRSDNAILYRMLGDLPVANVLRTTLNLPQSITKLPIERQAEVLKAGLQKLLGVTSMSDIASPANVDKLLDRFHIMSSINSGPSANTPGVLALSLLSGGSYGFGANASQNLFLSLMR
ncbi:DUF1217 domain-containing protein [Hyphomonas sp.]|uniref:DUF1217 domain-containing protein n=1 Tax=Hyphomonas sp. TaxID=87 RepID=UPI00391927DE